MKNRLFWLSILVIFVLIGWKITLLLFAFTWLVGKAILLIAAIFLALLAWELLKRKGNRL